MAQKFGGFKNTAATSEQSFRARTISIAQLEQYLINLISDLQTEIADLRNQIASGGISTEGLAIKSIISTEAIFYVRNGAAAGGDGKSVDTAFDSIEIALISLAANYEISGHLIIDLDTTHDLRAADFPSFTGSGKITIRSSAAKTTITFEAFEGSTEPRLSNWSGLDMVLENITFNKGGASKFYIEGGKITLNNIDFTTLEVEFDNCRATYLKNCKSSTRSRFYRSTLFLDACVFTAEFFYSQIETVNCQFIRQFICEACNILLRNPRFNFSYYTVTASIINSTIEFKASWLTFVNAGGNPQTRDFVLFQNCILKDFPSNVDVQGSRSFYEASILKFVNCLTPEVFNNVNYNFSSHSFIKDAYAIELINTAFLKNLNITGASIYRDPFSILGGQNYDNSTSGIDATTLQEAIDYLVENI